MRRCMNRDVLSGRDIIKRGHSVRFTLRINAFARTNISIRDGLTATIDYVNDRRSAGMHDDVVRRRRRLDIQHPEDRGISRFAQNEWDRTGRETTQTKASVDVRMRSSPLAATRRWHAEDRFDGGVVQNALRRDQPSVDAA